MNYSLGNMLGGNNGSLNPDKLSLNLQFATDKTLTARKGPTPTFTRASTATFIGSDGLIQSSAVNAARFDHDPITLACRGLLIEESRTNFHLRSEDLSVSPWSRSGTNITVNSGVAPDGLTTADLIYENTALSAHTISSLVTGTSVGSPYVHSVYLKAAGRNIVALGDWGGLLSEFNLSTGQVIAGGNGSPQIQNAGNGWYRCSITGNSTATNVTPGFRLRAISGVNSYLGDGASGVLAWGAQFEAGSFPTSYIPTTTASVVRSVDLCSISGSNFTGFWNQSAGTLVETFEASPNTNTTYASASNGNIVQNSLHLDNDTGLMRAVYYSGSANVATLDLGAVGTVGTVNTIATAYSVNDFAASRNGGTVVTDTSGAVPASLSQINIGTDERSQTPTSFYSNRCIKSLRYYKKRLANAKLQTLST